MASEHIMVIGLGNLLLGDDGFGSGVIDYLTTEYCLPNSVELIDAGTGAGDLLLHLLFAPEAPQALILVDAVDVGASPGSVLDMRLDEIPDNKVIDFSLHQSPSLGILRGLRDERGIDVSVIGCQIECIPDQIRPGLSEPVGKAVAKAGQHIYRKIKEWQ